MEVFSYETRSAQNMDCKSMGSEGYIAVVNKLDTVQTDDSTKRSPIFQLKDDKVVPVQYIVRPHQRRVHFFKYHNELLMWQSFQTNTDRKTNGSTAYCPLMKWFETTFHEVDQIPCTNAMQIESFIIDHRIYVAVANYMDEHQNIETHSTIYQYDIKEHKFSLIQRIKTFGAIDIKHVHLNDNHYLIVANSFRTHGSVHNGTITSNAVVYLYENEHSKFVPVQILPFENEVTQLLPYLVGTFFWNALVANFFSSFIFSFAFIHQGENKEFALMASMLVGTAKMYEYDGFQFFETPVTFTGGSLGRGISKMRTFNMSDDSSVLGNCESTLLARLV